MARIRDDEFAKKYGDRDTPSQFYDLESDDIQKILKLAVYLYLSTNPDWLIRWIDRLPESQKLDEARWFAGDLVGSKLLKIWTNRKSLRKRKRENYDESGKKKRKRKLCEECGQDPLLHCWNCFHTKRIQPSHLRTDESMNIDPARLSARPRTNPISALREGNAKKRRFASQSVDKAPGMYLVPDLLYELGISEGEWTRIQNDVFTLDRIF